MLIKKSKKLTLRQPITIYTPHSVLTIINTKKKTWLSPKQMAKYQATLLDQKNIQLQTSNTLNPATLMPLKQDKRLQHNYIKTIKNIYASRPNLKNAPLPNTNLKLYTDKNSFINNKTQKTGYAVITS